MDNAIPRASHASFRAGRIASHVASVERLKVDFLERRRRVLADRRRKRRKPAHDDHVIAQVDHVRRVHSCREVPCQVPRTFAPARPARDLDLGGRGGFQHSGNFPMVFLHSGARDFDLGGGFQHSGNYPMVVLHSAAGFRRRAAGENCAKHFGIKFM